MSDPLATTRQCNSTKTALLSLQNDMLFVADAGQGSAIVLLDLSTTFDTIDHNVVFDRLNDHSGPPAYYLYGLPLQV